MTRFKARAAQFVWFVADSSNFSADDIMRALLQVDPDWFQKNKIPNPSQPFLSVAGHSSGDYQINVNVAPGRIDIFFNPPALQNSNAGAFPSIDALSAMSLYLSHLKKLEVSYEGIYRVAVVIPFVEEFSNFSEVKQEFFRKLGVDVWNGVTSDLSFQVNYRKHIGVALPDINRLFSLSYDNPQQYEMAGPTVSLHDFARGRMVREGHFLVSAIDVNTVPLDNRVFSKGELERIFDVMCKECQSLKQSKFLGEIR